MRERIDLYSTRLSINRLETCKRICSINIHRTTSTDSFSARSSKGQSRILFIFDLDECIENHGSAFLQVDRIVLNSGWLIGFGIPPVYLECLEVGLRGGGERSSRHAKHLCCEKGTMDLEGVLKPSVLVLQDALLQALRSQGRLEHALDNINALILQINAQHELLPKHDPTAPLKTAKVRVESIRAILERVHARLEEIRVLVRTRW